MRNVIVLITELFLIAVAIFIADAWQTHSNVIPRSLIHLPQVDYSQSEFWLILKIFLGLHLTAFLLMQFKSGAWTFGDVKRSVNEIFLLISVYSFSALTVFLATTANFDPDLMAGIGLSSIGLFLLTHLVAAFISKTSPLRCFSELISGLFKKLFSATGILVLTLALTPPAMAYAFTSNRDFANLVTQIRINVSGLFASSHSYALVSVTGSQVFHQPMLARMAPNDPNTLYVLERSGQILRFPYPYSPKSTPQQVMNLQDKVGYIEVENGALGFTFHPEFGKSGSPNNNYLYLYYTDVRDDKQVNRVSRFDLSRNSPDEVIQSETPLLVLNRENSGFHNGGSVEFGLDGFLYIALGEGIHLEEKSQAKTLREGIIRIDVDRKGGSISHPVKEHPVNGEALNYYIPSDNPFVGRADIREEYWATGLRNPFRVSFDSKTGNLWAGDVGSTKWEEVNLIRKGGNYQFPFIEGYEKSSSKPKQVIGKETSPTYTYLHTAYDRAVIGGVVYRDGDLPELEGRYLFADNYSSKLFSMPIDKERVNEVQEIARASQYAQRGVSSVSRLTNGDILVTTLGRASSPTGEILKLTDSDEVGTKTLSPENNQPRIVSSEEAREIFVTNCSRCHGASGKADGPDSTLLGIEIRDFSSQTFQAERSDSDLQKIISEGGAAFELSPLMPPWQGALEKEEVNALVTYIRSLDKQ